MCQSVTDADEIVLLRHIPGGTHFQGKPPPRITSENFHLRKDPDTGELERGVSVSKTTMGSLYEHARRVLERRRTSPDSRMGYAKKSTIEAAGFIIQDDPTNDDSAHCIIKSHGTRLEDHAGRKKLAATFTWVQFPPEVGRSASSDMLSGNSDRQDQDCAS